MALYWRFLAGLSFIKFGTPTKMIKVGRGGYMEQQEEGISMNLAGP